MLYFLRKKQSPIISEVWPLKPVKAKTEYSYKKQRGSPAVRDRDNAGAVLSDLEEHRHSKVKVSSRRVAPPAIVIWKRVVRRAKVCGCDQNRRATRMTKLWVTCALDLKASPTAKAVVEQCSAQCSRVHSVALAVQVSVPTSSTCGRQKIVYLR